MGKPKHNFLVSVEGNRLYEIRTSRGLMIKEFLPMIGMKTAKNNQTLTFCESVAMGRPLSKTILKYFPNQGITDTTAKKIAEHLQMPVSYIFPAYDRCERENQREPVFHTVEEKNEEILRLSGVIKHMVLSGRWDTITHEMDYCEAIDIGILTVVEIANEVYERGMRKDSNFFSYAMKAVRFRLLKKMDADKSVSFYENSLFEQLASRNAYEETKSFVFMSGISNAYDDPLDIVCAKETVRERLQTAKARATL